MTNHPDHRQPEGSDRTDIGSYELAPVERHRELTPAQHTQLQALIAQAVAGATERTKSDPPAAGDSPDLRPGLGEPGVLIAILMLALVTIIALVVMFAIVIGA